MTPKLILSTRGTSLLTKGLWKESSQANKPEKDRDYQNTLLVKQWLAGN